MCITYYFFDIELSYLVHAFSMTSPFYLLNFDVADLDLGGHAHFFKKDNLSLT